MLSWFINLNIYIQVLIASTFTFLMTSLGSLLVFFFKKVNNNILDIMLGVSAGVMLSSSFFSLLNPSIEESLSMGLNPAIVVSIGFILGSLFLILSDIFFTKKLNKKDNLSSFKRSIMLIFSITLHNIPEGLAIGVAFGTISVSSDSSLIAALLLAIGIGIQNFPEGSAVSLPLRREGLSPKKSFLYGTLSGIVEPISALIGCALVIVVQNILPYLLSFAASAMIYVVVSELIPESSKNPHKHLISLSIIFGFLIMMILDISL